MARILSAMHVLTASIDESEGRSPPAAAQGEVRKTDDFRTVNERIQGEISLGAQALETLQQAFSGLLRINAPAPGGDIGDWTGRDGHAPAAASHDEYDARQVRLWQKAFEASADGIVITDSRERILLVNPAVSTITGYAPEEVIGQTPRIFQSGRHDREFYCEMWSKIATNGHWHGEIWDRRKNGEIYPKWLSISAVCDPVGGVTHYVALFSDITERKSHADNIEFLAYHDALTGLPNRRLLRDRFEREVAHARRQGFKVHLLFLDLDHFKEVNDKFGHAVGDGFLQTIVGRLKTCLRATDTIGRLGGDEFVIVLSDVHGVVDLPHILHKLQASLGEPIVIDGNTLKASTSIGIGICPDDGEDFETLVKKADTAMYQAKKNSRGSYLYFDKEMNAAAQERLALEQHLRSAVENGEIYLAYEPQARLGARRVAGVEAFLRWNHPTLGSVDPRRFIPVAEDCGLMPKIGEWALREACRQAKAWHTAGWTDLTVSFKLAPSQYGQGDFLDVVSTTLAETGISAGSVELGFSESSMVSDKGTVVDTAKRLKGLGVRLFLDGFGSGCTRLDCLKRAAVDRLKIDRSLVSDLPHNKDNAAIVRAAIQMANCLDLTVIADGVSSEPQIAFLRNAGCDLAQGPLFGTPQAAQPTPDWT